jgi:hypothetical protein
MIKKWKILMVTHNRSVISMGVGVWVMGYISCWMVCRQWSSFTAPRTERSACLEINVEIYIRPKNKKFWFSDYAAPSKFRPMGRFYCLYIFLTVSKFYKNLVKWTLTEMLCSVAGTTTLDRECVFTRSHAEFLLSFSIDQSFKRLSKLVRMISPPFLGEIFCGGKN